MQVEFARLTGLIKLGGLSGGQGQLFAADAAVAARIGLGVPVVVKTYLRPPPLEAASELRNRIDWCRALDDDSLHELLGVAAWPLALVVDKGLAVGIIMEDMRPRYEAQMTLPSGRREPVLTSLEHVLKDDAFLKRRFGVDFDTSARAHVALALSASLAVLHKHGIVASDFSHRNLLVQLTKPHAATFIDCDSMVFRGRRALKLVETPGWEMTDRFGEQATSKSADNYKLGLAIMRLFAREQFCTDLDSVLPHIPEGLRNAMRSSLNTKQRRSAAEWQLTIREVRGRSLVKRYPGPRPRVATSVHPAIKAIAPPLRRAPPPAPAPTIQSIPAITVPRPPQPPANPLSPVAVNRLQTRPLPPVPSPPAPRQSSGGRARAAIVAVGLVALVAVILATAPHTQSSPAGATATRPVDKHKVLHLQRGRRRWIIQAASFRLKRHARQELTILLRGLPVGVRAGLLRSGQFRELRRGYWVVYVGVARRRHNISQSLLKKVNRAGLRDAFIRHVTGN